jgi:hypothetical protein
MFAERGFPTLLVPNRDIGVQTPRPAVEGRSRIRRRHLQRRPRRETADQDENGEKTTPAASS